MYALMKKDGSYVTQWDLYNNKDYLDGSMGNDIREDLLSLDSPVISKTKKRLEKLLKTSEAEYQIPGVVIVKVFLTYP